MLSNPFKTYKDSRIKSFDKFILNAEGDYDEKEIEKYQSPIIKGLEPRSGQLYAVVKEMSRRLSYGGPM